MAATPDAARAADFVAPPEGSTTVVAEQSGPQSLTFGSGTAGQQAPALRDDAASGLPEGNQWRYSEFINAVQGGKVERVRFSKDGSMLQLTAIDGRRATVVLPNDPDLVDILARNGVDISVSEGEQQLGQ
ncbi:cell division protease FtsH [Monoraphidium neglectum]|uniref:Cell division protease FtsH n=1 Tax=Monoraphidium neglectum TaxID=145388 RepID=A0A0D2MYG6_9CHLO|nr:cell division protease FtsH [Monoraphidium neglectum]KIZ07525.1 cell division protease FtsH [Monoraphidium neglectum]|eukprot:XP_013906544.1 cell division protease FtsH [Monoraphidium neglectum]